MRKSDDEVIKRWSSEVTFGIKLESKSKRSNGSFKRKCGDDEWFFLVKLMSKKVRPLTSQIWFRVFLCHFIYV